MSHVSLLTASAAATLILAMPLSAQTGTARSWSSDDDLPTHDIAKSTSGVTNVQFDVTEKGRAKNCVVISSSGSEALDRKSCAVVLGVPRFAVAKDESGNPIPATQTRRIDWKKQR